MDTVVPAVLIKSGGGPVAVGVLTAIMLGISKLFQLVFSRSFEPFPYKQKYLITGIFLRIFSLLLLAIFACLGNQTTSFINLSDFKLSTKEKQFLLLPSFFPLLSILGMHFMNTTNNNAMLMILLFFPMLQLKEEENIFVNSYTL